MEKTLKSGAKLLITRSDFEICDRLLMAVANELKQVGVDIGLKSLAIGEDSVDKDKAINTIKNAFLQLVGAASIRPILWECMERVTYNGAKVTRATFNDDKAVGDYLTVAGEVMVSNLAPFFPGLSSKLSNLAGQIIKDPSTK